MCRVVYNSNERSVDFCPIADIDSNSTVLVSISTSSPTTVPVSFKSSSAFWIILKTFRFFFVLFCTLATKVTFVCWGVFYARTKSRRFCNFRSFMHLHIQNMRSRFISESWSRGRMQIGKRGEPVGEFRISWKVFVKTKLQRRGCILEQDYNQAGDITN